MSGLLELAARCEAATGADDATDWAIAEAVGCAPGLPYTASLDAAMTLVPEGWFCRITSAGNCDIANSAWLAEDGDQRSFYVDAATPALALCAAALKARAATRQGDAQS